MLIYKLRKICQEDIVLESIRTVIDFVNNLLWGKNILVVMLIGTAVYFTFKTRFMQFRLFGDIVKILGKDDKNKEGISSLEAFFFRNCV